MSIGDDTNPLPVPGSEMPEGTETQQRTETQEGTAAAANPHAAEETAATTPIETTPASAAVESEAPAVPEAPAVTEAVVAPEPTVASEQETTPPLGHSEPQKIVRGSGPLAARGLGVAKPSSPTTSTDQLAKATGTAPPKTKSEQTKDRSGQSTKHPRPRLAGESSEPAARPPDQTKAKTKVAVPNRRDSLPDDIQAELDAQLASADVEGMLGGSAGMPDRKEPLEEGARVHGQVLKIHEDSVFVGLGGPDEGFVPLLQFEEEPVADQSIEVIVRGISSADGLYILSLPGGTVDVTDWEDLDEGSVVDVTVTGSNSGGLECKVGGLKGFIPISQVTEYRIEELGDFVDQKFKCVVTEANERRGNLVLSRRAILERERAEKREEQLAKIEVGELMEGTVRSIKDFGAFVDLGGLDGLIHISKLSWDRVKHPSEVLEEGQKVQVRIEKVDKETGRIGLSYRDLLENPWDTAESDYAVGSVLKGTVTRIAAFGCFVKLGPGVEGLVHISELAHHRVSRVSTVVSEDQEIEVKVLSFDRDSQKVGLSIKAAQNAPAADAAKSSTEEVDEPPRDLAVKATHTGPLKGGNNRDTGGERFGLRW